MCFQNPADSALVMEKNWPTLQCWLLLLLRFVQKLICQQPLESRGGRAQRCPSHCRLTTLSLSSSLSPKPNIPPKLRNCRPKVSAVAVDEALWWRLRISFGSPLTTETFEKKKNQMLFRLKVRVQKYSDRMKSHNSSCINQRNPFTHLINVHNSFLS